MKKLGAFLLLAALAAVMAGGCIFGGDDDATKPAVTRITASESCGVAPLSVEFRADASGGVRMDDPTGGNSFLRLRWDFGDGSGVHEGSSVAYHTYSEPDTYLVTVVAEDDDGNVSPPFSRPIVVLGDTLAVAAFTTVSGAPGNSVRPCEPITFGITAHGCDFDPETGYYERFLYTWTIDQPGGPVVYRVARPVHAFPPTAAGDYEVQLTVEDPSLSLTRRLTVPVTVVAGQGAEVSLSADWLADEPVSPDYVVPQADLPDTLTYAVSLTCAGPDDAYDVRVRGLLPLNDQIAVLDTRAFGDDQLSYVVTDSSGSALRSFFWTVPHIAAGETRSAEVEIMVNVIQLNAVVNFWNRIQGYPCDLDTTNNRVRVRLTGGL